MNYSGAFGSNMPSNNMDDEYLRHVIVFVFFLYETTCYQGISNKRQAKTPAKTLSLIVKPKLRRCRRMAIGIAVPSARAMHIVPQTNPNKECDDDDDDDEDDDGRDGHDLPEQLKKRCEKCTTKANVTSFALE